MHTPPIQHSVDPRVVATKGRWALATSLTGGYAMHQHLAQSDIRATLAALTPAAPLVNLRALSKQGAKRLSNAFRRGPSGVRCTEGAVRVVGIGRAGHAHMLSREDLLPYAKAELVIRLAEGLETWFARHFASRSPRAVPDVLRASAAIRATWSIGRVALEVQAVLTALPASDHRNAVLRHLLWALTRIARPWLHALPLAVHEHTFTSRENYFALLTGKYLNRSTTLMCSGSAVVADIRRQPVLEATIRPALTLTDVGAQIARWLISSDTTAVVVGNTLRTAAVAMADPLLVRREACLAYDTEIWAAAALALFPSLETLALARAPGTRSRTRAALVWSAAQIEAALIADNTQPPAAARTRTDMLLHFDGLTVTRAAELLGQHGAL